MFTYGYIREATMAHLDLDESEAQAMNLLSKFHIFANEAMQAICSSKPMYQYIDVEIVDKYAPLVAEGAYFRLATDTEINWNIEEQGEPDFKIATPEQTRDYYSNLGIYQVGDIISMNANFIAFADKQAYKIVESKPTVSELLAAEAFGKTIKSSIKREDAKVDLDFSYIGKNKLKFYKTGKYEIPAKFLWYRFDSGMSDEQELDIPADILLTIPLYIAAICYQVDNTQRAQLMRQEFEIALSRCTSTDFMTLNKVESTW